MSKLSFSFLPCDAVKRSQASSLSFKDDPGLTDPSFKDECDINVMMRRGEHSMLSAHVARYGASYGDFSGEDDYHSALCKIRDADDMFMSLPASVRSKFSNDVGAFVDFVNDDANFDAVVDLGLCVPGTVKRGSSPQGDKDPKGDVKSGGETTPPPG